MYRAETTERAFPGTAHTAVKMDRSFDGLDHIEQGNRFGALFQKDATAHAAPRAEEAAASKPRNDLDQHALRNQLPSGNFLCAN